MEEEEVRFPMACRIVPEAERRLVERVRWAHRLRRTGVALDAVRQLAILTRFKERYCIPPGLRVVLGLRKNG